MNVPNARDLDDIRIKYFDLINCVHDYKNQVDKFRFELSQQNLLVKSHDQSLFQLSRLLANALDELRTTRAKIENVKSSTHEK